MHNGRALEICKGNPLNHWLNTDLYMQSMKLQEAGARTTEKKKAIHFLEVAQGWEHFAFSLAVMKRLSTHQQVESLDGYSCSEAKLILG